MGRERGRRHSHDEVPHAVADERLDEAAAVLEEGRARARAVHVHEAAHRERAQHALGHEHRHPERVRVRGHVVCRAERRRVHREGVRRRCGCEKGALVPRGKGGGVEEVSTEVAGRGERHVPVIWESMLPMTPALAANARSEVVAMNTSTRLLRK